MVNKYLRGTATEPIEFGQHVLCRNRECSPASPSVANAIAVGKPRWAWQKRYEKGDFVTAERIEGLGDRDLTEIANGPIMEPLTIYLPAGKLTMAEYQERLDLQFREAGIKEGEA